MTKMYFILRGTKALGGCGEKGSSINNPSESESNKPYKISTICPQSCSVRFSHVSCSEWMRRLLYLLFCQYRNAWLDCALHLQVFSLKTVLEKKQSRQVSVCSINRYSRFIWDFAIWQIISVFRASSIILLYLRDLLWASWCDAVKLNMKKIL